MLFDLVARDLNESENLENQAFLEVSAGYWLRLAMASDSDCIGKLLAQFAGISRDLLASNTRRGSGPNHRSVQVFSSLSHSNVQSGMGLGGSLNYSDTLPVPPHREGENLHTSVREATESNPITTDPWFGIWDFGEDMTWIDIVGTPRLR